jgi:hypothetical protein
MILYFIIDFQIEKHFIVFKTIAAFSFDFDLSHAIYHIFKQLKK